MHRLKNIVCYELYSDEEKKIADEHGITLYTFDEVVKVG